MYTFRTLVVSSDLFHRRQIADILNRQGADSVCATSLRESFDILAQQSIELVFCDRDLRDGSYKDLLQAYRFNSYSPKVVVISPDLETDVVKEALKMGAYHVISSPCRPTDVEWMMIQAKRDVGNAEPALKPIMGGVKLTRAAMA
jgi:DNA-binding NtrC family response regulator